MKEKARQARQDFLLTIMALMTLTCPPTRVSLAGDQGHFIL